MLQALGSIISPCLPRLKSSSPNGRDLPAIWDVHPSAAAASRPSPSADSGTKPKDIVSPRKHPLHACPSTSRVRPSTPLRKRAGQPSMRRRCICSGYLSEPQSLLHLLPAPAPSTSPSSRYEPFGLAPTRSRPLRLCHRRQTIIASLPRGLGQLRRALLLRTHPRARAPPRRLFASEPALPHRLSQQPALSNAPGRLSRSTP